MIGNFITDFIRGKANFDALPENIQKGVFLHRDIDRFTDAHPIVKRNYQRLKPQHGRYAAVVIDVLFDYFLINNWRTYSDEAFEDWEKRVYTILEAHQNLYPAFLQRRLPLMISDNFLSKYGTYEGLAFAFDKIANRTRFDNNMQDAVSSLQANEAIMNDEFNEFYPELLRFVQQSIQDKFTPSDY